MKTCNISKTHLLRVLRIGTALGTAIFAATALQGQSANPTIPQAPVAGTSSPDISSSSQLKRTKLKSPWQTSPRAKPKTPQ
jgi:hypothetical protein